MKDFLKDVFDMTWQDFKFWLVVWVLLIISGALVGVGIGSFILGWDNYIKLF